MGKVELCELTKDEMMELVEALRLKLEAAAQEEKQLGGKLC